MTSIVLEQPVPEPNATSRLRIALADPSLELVYRRSSTGTWIDDLGVQIEQSVLDSVRPVTPLERDGDWVAGLIHDPALLEHPERIQAECFAVATSIDDERLKAELRAQIRDEQSSRARILAASDRQRRRFERNLHDGAQQRLVGLALMLRLAGRRADNDRPVSELIGEAVGELDDAISDLRELARGLHPAIVSDAGLSAALESLAERPGIPVELTIDLPDRLPDHLEVGGYYLVAEALTNANKHSAASAISVTARVLDDTLQISVSDDGRGGVTTSGSGLIGLADRIGALGGHLIVDSDAQHGTTVSGYLPLAAPAAHAQQLDDILLRVLSDADSAGPYPTGSTRQARWIRGDRDRRRRALKWIAWQMFAAPGEIIDAQAESEDWLHARAMLLFLGGNRQISSQRRDWLIGYLTAAGYSESVLEAAANYDDSDKLEDIMSNPRIAIAARVILHDSLRACAMDGTEVEPSAFEPVLRSADAVGMPRELVADLHAIVLEEARLRQRRHDLIVAPALPKLLNDSIAITRGESPHPE